MAKVPAQTTTVMNADLAALNGQLTVLRGLRKAIPAGVNPREIQLLDKQIRQLDAVTVTLKHRIARAA